MSAKSSIGSSFDKKPRGRVLIVEPHAATARVLELLLSEHGYLPYIAGTASTALRWLEEEPFDLMISVIGLPDMDGCLLLERIRLRWEIKAIAFSAYAAGRDAKRSRDSGFAAHLVKPAAWETLLEIIERVTTTADEQ